MAGSMGQRKSALYPDEELPRLMELLEAETKHDLDYVLGLLHAIAIAPGRVPPSVWMESVLPVRGGSPSAAAEELVSSVARMYDDVVDGLEKRMGRIPEADYLEGCRSFSAGNAEGASLDPLWIGDDDRWTFAAPMALLGERYDLVSPALRKEHASDPEFDATSRQYLAATVAAAYDSFAAVRRGVKPSTPTPRPGRNDPCRCGSGKKFKRCCG
jgi:uncharacterized protein